ncbi:MAG: hypothetical protein U1F60_12050 [Planctomycetota bacterium]
MKLLALVALFAACAASADHDVVQVTPPAQPETLPASPAVDLAVERWIELGSRSFATRDEAYAFDWKLEQAGLRTLVQFDPIERCWVCRFA